MNQFISLSISLQLLCSISIFSFNQTNLDSLLQLRSDLTDSEEKVKILSSLYNAVLYTDPELAKLYAAEELELSKKIGFKEGIALSWYHLGVYYNNISDYDTAKYYYTQSKILFDKLGIAEKILTVNHAFAILEYSQGNYDDALEILQSNIELHNEIQYDTSSQEKAVNLAITHDLLGQIELFRGNYNLALQEALKAIKLLEVLDKPIRKADALNHLASIEFSLNNFDECISYNKKALEIYEKYNDKMYQAQVLNDLGNTYYYLKNYDDAIEYLDKSMVIGKEINAGDLLGTAINNLAKVYAKKNMFDKAMELSNDALEIHESSNSQNKIVESLNDLGMTYNAMSKPKTAIQYFDRAIALAEKIDTKENLRIGHYNRSHSYEMLNDFQRALADFKDYKKTEDSIFSETKSRQIEELRTIYETEQKEKEIELQRSEIQLLNEKEKVSALQRTILAIAFVVLVIVISLVYYGLRQKMRRNKVERERLDAELEFKRKELTTHALHLANKNEVLESLKDQIKVIKSENGNHREYNRIINTINLNLHDDTNWENFSRYFEEVHKDFSSHVKLRFPDVTSNELRLMALLKMNLSSKEIASMLNISSEGIKKARYRLRKKLGIGSDDSLQDIVIGL